MLRQKSSKLVLFLPTCQVCDLNLGDIIDQLTIGAGLQDTNLARVKATQDYLLRCDHIFVVTKISRAITNQSLKSSLVSVVSKHAEMEWDDLSGAGGMKIAIICTNSEVILHFMRLLER